MITPQLADVATERLQNAPRVAKAMKVLLCHNYYQLPGGEDRVFEDEATLLEQRGHEVVRFTLSNDQIEDMSRWEVARRTFWNRQVAAELRATIRRERPQLMHCTNVFPLISPAAYYVARREGVPVVQTLQNYRLICPAAVLMRDGRVCEDCVGKQIAWPAIRHKCYRDSRLGTACVAGMVTTHRWAGTWHRAVTRYVTATQFARQKFISAGFRPEQIRVKPNFVSPTPPPGRGEGGYYAFVGRLAPEKGIDALLAAWRSFDGRLKILGDGPLADRVAQFAAAHEHVEWLGHQSGEAVQQIVADATALIVPSLWYEGLPKTVIEAFSVGTPMIASDLGAMAEVITPDETGLLFAPGDAERLRDRLEQIDRSPGLAQAMRSNVRRAFEQRYTAERNYEMLRAIYEEAVQAGGKG